MAEQFEMTLTGIKKHIGLPAHISIDATTFVDLGDGRTRVVTDSYRALDALLAQRG